VSVMMLCDDKVKMREEREDREKNAKIGGLFSTVRFFFSSFLWGGALSYQTSLPPLPKRREVYERSKERERVRERNQQRRRE
jgi:hypothetical protein